MALDFPASPSNGQIYYDPSSGNRYVYVAAYQSWVYDANNNLTASNTNVLYLNNGYITGSNNFEYLANTLYVSNVAVAQNVSATYYFGNGAFLLDVTHPANLLAANNYSSVLAANNAVGANNWANTVGLSANTYLSILAANNAVGANNWANTVGIAGNNYTNHVGLSVNTYASILVANNAVGANNWANTKLSNTDNVWTAGSLNIPVDLYIGRNLTNVTQLTFNTGTNITPPTAGALTWSQDDSTLHFNMDTPSGVVGHIGQDQFYLVKNQTGETITKGSVVRFAGTLGASGRLLVSKATANNSVPSTYIMGVATADITNGSDGFVTSFGKLRNIDTSMFSAGDILYASTTTPGGYQNTAPDAPNNKVTIAAVIHSDAVTGSIQIRPTWSNKLANDEQVKLNGLANGDLLRWNATYGRFENFNENATGPAINATAAFAHSNATAIGANNWANTVGVAGNNWTNTVGLSANSYAGFMVNSSNSYANTTYVKLISPSQIITGDITVAGNVNVQKDLHVTGNVYFTDSQTLTVSDPLIYLAGNNYTSDLVDIGFVANYVNSSSINVHTGLYRSSISKEYYLFQEYNKEPDANYIDYTGNNFTLAVLNADIITNNLFLAGANAVNRISSAFDKANAAYNNANVGFAAANAYANAVGTAGNNYTNYVGASDNAYMLYVTTSGNTYAGQMANSANAYTYATGVAGNNVTYAVGNAGNSYTQQVGTAGNNYTNAVGIAGNNYVSILAANNAVGANNWANTVGIAGNNYTNSVGAAGNNYATATYATLSNVAQVYQTTNISFNTANAAYAAANNITPQVAPSYNTANAAYNQANAAYVEANANYTTTNIAFDTANAAFAVANNISPQVAPSYNTANAAFIHANSAYDKANVGGANVSNTSPVSPVNGQLWWDTESSRLYIYYTDPDSSQWVEATPTPEIDKNYYDLTNLAFNTANSSYVMGNANYTTTNIAFDTANAAFAAANNVAPQVTPSYNTANMAFNTANAAYAAANNITPQVAPSYNTANAAFDTANAAFAAANNITPQVAPSYNTANAAFNTANASFGYANSLNTFVSVTYSTIVQLNYAWNTANIAYSIANAAFDKANTAGGGYFTGNNGDKGAPNAGDIFRVHSNTMSQSVTILSGNNAICAGPLNIVGANTTLTIQTGARVSIV